MSRATHLSTYQIGYNDGMEDASNRGGILNYSVSSKIKISKAVANLEDYLKSESSEYTMLAIKSSKLLDVLIEELNL